MPSLPLPGEDRPPIWRQMEVWRAAAASGRLLAPLHRPALRLTDGEPRPAVNHYVMELGPQQLLHGRGAFAHALTGEVCGFDRASDWPAQRVPLVRIFRAFYPSDEEFVGWYSLVTARRPAQYRQPHDATLSIWQGPARTTYLDPEDDASAHFDAPLDGVRFAHPHGVPRPWCRVAMNRVPRKVVCPRFGICGGYEEAWFCLAREGEDDTRLRLGRIPAVPDGLYQNDRVRVRDTVMLSLIRLTRQMVYHMRVFELDRGGAVLSVRRSRMPLGPAVCSSPIEHDGLATVLQ